MITKLFAVYDSAVSAYFRPFHMLTKGEALRAWIDACNDPKSPFSQHPECYTLFEIGEFDDQSGRLTNYDAFISHGNAVEYCKRNVGVQAPEITPVDVNNLKTPDETKLDNLKISKLK